MTGVESQDGVIDIGALWKDLQELEIGSLPPERRDALMALLARSPAAQEAYIGYFEMAAMLGAEAATHAEQGKLPVVGQSQLPLRFFGRSLLAAAAVLALGALVASLFIVKTPVGLSAEATEGALWVVDGAAKEPGAEASKVQAGSTVHVRSGTLRLEFETGATLVIQGPARVAFPQLDRPALAFGWLWIDSGDSEEQFEIATPELRVRDIGTRFGVRVPGQGPTEVHLIEGAVEVSARSSSKRIAVLVPEGRGVAITATGETTGMALARDPFPDLAELLAAPANYAATVASQNPAGFWRMEMDGSGKLGNEIPEGTSGRRHMAAVKPTLGPGPGDGFAGFEESNGAARLDGKIVRAPLSFGTTPVHEGLLFREDFSGDGALHDTAPDEARSGAKWIASPVFGKDGAVMPGAGSATLALSPVSGAVYTLDASLRDLTGGGSWVALGFANGQSEDTGVHTRFISKSVVGRAWILARGDKSVAPNRAYLGTSGTNGGLADNRVWSGPLANLRGDLDLRVVLDTSGGVGTWKATWYAKRPGEAGYTKVSDTRPLLNEEIRSVGLAVNGSETSGRITNFSLHAERSASGGLEAHLASEPADVSHREGAVSFWIRSAPSAGKREILWAAGESPSENAIQAHLEPDGRVGFFMENGRFDVLLTSEEKIAEERWHHIAISWSPLSMNLYLDGRLTAIGNDFRGILQGTLTEARFGNGAASSGAAPFNGRVDEIALWNRALTPAEVLHQFLSAQGEMK